MCVNRRIYGLECVCMRVFGHALGSVSSRHDGPAAGLFRALVPMEHREA